MEASKLYKSLADPQRLRILNLLEAGPLCVCHLQELLGDSQVKVSKHLSALKQAGLVEAHREGTWMIYELVEPVNGLLLANLDYLRTADCGECCQLKTDLLERSKLVLRVTGEAADCPESVCERLGCA